MWSIRMRLRCSGMRLSQARSPASMWNTLMPRCAAGITDRPLKVSPRIRSASGLSFSNSSSDLRITSATSRP